MASKPPAKATHESHPTVDWAHKITEAWHKTVAAFIEIGDLLIEAKAVLPHGEFHNMIRSELPFEERTAQRLMDISKCQHVRQHRAELPPHWPTIYELTHLDSEAFAQAVEQRVIHTEMTRQEATKLTKQDAMASGAKRVASPAPEDMPPLALFKTLANHVANLDPEHTAKYALKPKERMKLLEPTKKIQDWLTKFIPAVERLGDRLLK